MPHAWILENGISEEATVWGTFVCILQNHSLKTWLVLIPNLFVNLGEKNPWCSEK